MTPDRVAGRFDNRPGYRLVDFGPVGLPIYRVTVIALTLVRKVMDPIEEFALRSIDAGLNRPSDVAGFLGIGHRIVDGSIANLIRSEHIFIMRDAGDTVIKLTDKGRTAVREHEEIKPAEQTIFFTFDGLTRKPQWYGDSLLLHPRELKERGIPEMRSFPARGPVLEELNVLDVAHVMQLSIGPQEAPRSLLRLKSLERRQSLFLEAVALAYRSESTGECQVAFAIDGRLSEDHELAVARAKGLEKTSLFRGLKVGLSEPPLEEVVGEDIAARLSPLAPPESLRIEAAQARGHVLVAEENLAAAESSEEKRSAESELDSARAALISVGNRLADLRVRPLAVYEHAELLHSAIAGATDRLLIVSPWIRRAVVDRDFLRGLVQAVCRGVKVYIGYGLGDADRDAKPADRDARSDLDLLAKEHERLTVKCLGDTHAKVLIRDHVFFVISSFNWLSFKGDPKRTFREEWGTYVGIPELVDEFFLKMESRFRPATRPWNDRPLVSEDAGDHRE